MEQIELFWLVNDMESEIYLFIKLTTGTFDDVTDVKSAEKKPKLDSYSNGNRASSPSRLLRCNNVLNRLNCSINHQDLKNTCVFERFQWFLFSDLCGPLNFLSNYFFLYKHK